MPSVGAERTVVTGPTLTQLPDNLRGLVAARLDGLSVEERRVLADAAVLGRRGDVGGLRIMAEESGAPEIDGGLEGLAAKELLVVDRGRWSFRSDLVREVVYSMMTKSDRAKRHAGVARWMETHIDDRPPIDRIAHHYATAARLSAEIGPTAGRPADSGRKTPRAGPDLAREGARPGPGSRARAGRPAGGHQGPRTG